MYVFVVIAFLFLPVVSWGVPIAPGEFGEFRVFLQGTSLAERPDLAGTIIAETTRPLDLRFLTSFSGDTATTPLQIRDWVVRTGGGTLDFYRQVICCRTTTNIRFGETLNFSSFAGVATDVDFRTDLDGKPFPGIQTAVRSADTVSFRYAPAGISLVGGFPVQQIFAKTDATTFNEGGVLRFDTVAPVGITELPLQDRNVFSDFYQPSIVPEPSTGFLLSSGLAGIALARFWKRMASSRSQ